MAKRNFDKPSHLIRPSSISIRLFNDDNSTSSNNINCHQQQLIVNANNHNSQQSPQQSFIPRRQSSELASQYLNYQAPTTISGKSIRLSSSSNNSPTQSNLNQSKYPAHNDINQQQQQQKHQKQAICSNNNKRNLNTYKTDKPTLIDTDQQPRAPYNGVLSPKKHYDCYPVHTLTNDVIQKPPKDSSIKSGQYIINKNNLNTDISDSDSTSYSSNNRKKRHYDATYQKMMNERRLTYTVTENDLPKKYFNANKQSLDSRKTTEPNQPDLHSDVPNMNVIGLPLRYNHYSDKWTNDNDNRGKLPESRLSNLTPQKQNIPTLSNQRRTLGDYVHRVNGYTSHIEPAINLRTNENKLISSNISQISSQQKTLDHQKQQLSTHDKLLYRSPLDFSSKIPKDELPRYNSRMVGNESGEQERRIARLLDWPGQKSSGSTGQPSSNINNNGNYLHDGKQGENNKKLSTKSKDSLSDDDNQSRQPKFEAFIMTGDSMIKLSSSETEKEQKQKLCPFTAELTPAELYFSQQQNKLSPEKSGIDMTNKDELDHKLNNKILYNDDGEKGSLYCDAQTSHICDTKVKTINKLAVNIISDGITTASSNDTTVDKQKVASMQVSATKDNSEGNGQIKCIRNCSPFQSNSEKNNAEFHVPNNSSSTPLNLGVNRGTQTSWIDKRNDEIGIDKPHERFDESTANNSVRSTSNAAVQCSSHFTLERSRKINDNNEIVDHQTITNASSPVSSASSGFYSSEIVDQNKQIPNQAIGHIDYNRIHHSASDRSNDTKTSITNNAIVAVERSDMSYSPSSTYATSIIDKNDATQRVKVKELFLESDGRLITDNSVKASKSSKPLFGFLSGRKLSSCDNLLVNGKIEDSSQHTTRVHCGNNNKNLSILSAALQQENNKSRITNDMIATTVNRGVSNSIIIKKNNIYNNNNHNNINNNLAAPNTDAQSTSIANAAKRLFFSSNKNITTNNLLPHAKDEYTYDKHYDKESHGKHKKSLKSRKDNDLQNVYPLHAAISHDDLSNGPIPGTIRLQQSHFSSTPSVAHDLRQNKSITNSGHRNLDKTDTIADEEGEGYNLFHQNTTQSISKNTRDMGDKSILTDNLLTGQDISSQNDIDRYKLSLKLHEDCHDDSGLQVNVTKSNTSPSQAADDRAAARRLAERLYKLDGFSESDVSQHLSRNNTFSVMVTEEYLQFFDFRGMSLDSALRKFFSKVNLNGETQERELILSKFSQHYYGCNKSKFAHWEAVQTLVCALILLNTDLQGGHSKSRSKLSMDAFIAGINDSTALFKSSGNDHCELKPFTFPKHMLVKLYGSIKKHPLKYSDDSNVKKFAAELDSIYSNGRANTLPTRRFVPGANAPTSTLTASARKQFKLGLRDEGLSDDMGDTSSSIDFKTGYLMRKRIFDANGKPTPRGRRSWKRVHITVKDLVIFMKVVEDSKPNSDSSTDISNSNAKSWSDNLRNSIRIHHAYASEATNYNKREFVFHLCIADQAEYLFQATSEQEMNSWIETINFATACLSAPVLPSAVGSNQKKIQRPLYPSSYTKLSFWEQLLDHDERLQKLKIELDEHLAKAPVTKKATKKDRSDFIEKIALLRHEIERYSTYVDCMRKKSNSPEAVLLSKHSKSLSSPFKP